MMSTREIVLEWSRKTLTHWVVLYTVPRCHMSVLVEVVVIFRVTKGCAGKLDNVTADGVWYHLFKIKPILVCVISESL